MVVWGIHDAWAPAHLLDVDARLRDAAVQRRWFVLDEPELAQRRSVVVAGEGGCSPDQGLTLHNVDYRH
jgi:hypothetical protein